jgi:hypothetical protein
MTDMTDDATNDTETTSEATGSETTQEATGSGQDDLVASYRKRQAGAEAARQVAEAKAKELETRLAKYEKDNQTAAEKDLSELAATKARLEAAEQRASEAEAKAEARVLDAKYPNARKELPEVVDETRLAKFEAILSDEGDTPPTPLRHNETKATGGKLAQEETADDVAARLRAMPSPFAT